MGSPIMIYPEDGRFEEKKQRKIIRMLFRGGNIVPVEHQYRKRRSKNTKATAASFKGKKSMKYPRRNRRKGQRRGKAGKKFLKGRKLGSPLFMLILLPAVCIALLPVVILLLSGSAAAVREGRYTVKRIRTEDGRRYREACRVPEDEIALEEAPELGIQWGTLEWGPPQYAWYKGTLIVGDNVYEKKGNAYVKTDTTVHDWFQDYGGVLYRQAGNKLVALLTGWKSDDRTFLIYDMDTGSLYTYLCEEDRTIRDWYIYKGYIYYISQNEERKRAIKRINLLTWESSEYFGEEDIALFAIQKDGDIIYELRDGYNREYWLLEKGEKEGRRIWEYDRWEFEYDLAYTEAGFVTYGQFFYVDEGHLGKEVLGEYVLITEEGEAKGIAFSNWNGTENYFCDFGYFAAGNIFGATEEPAYVEEEDWGKNEYITLYSYDNERLESYRMADPELLEEGYRLEEFFYHKGRLTAFYVQDETEELYISQAYVEEADFEED